MKLCGLIIRTAKQVMKDANFFLQKLTVIKDFHENAKTSNETVKFGSVDTMTKNEANTNIADNFRQVKAFILIYEESLNRRFSQI